MFRQAKLSNYFTQQGRDVKKDGKRKLEETSEQTELKKNRVEKKKITSFFVPKPKKALCNDSQDVIIQKEQTKSDIAPNGVEKAVKSTKDNSSAVTAWSTMFNKAALVAPLCAGHSEACVRRKVLKEVEMFSIILKTPRSTRKGLIQAGSSGVVLVGREGISVLTKILFLETTLYLPQRG